jgi:hypothetical protein
MSSCRLVGHVDDQYHVSGGVVPGCLQPEVYKNAVVAAGIPI